MHILAIEVGIGVSQHCFLCSWSTAEDSFCRRCVLEVTADALYGRVSPVINHVQLHRLHETWGLPDCRFNLPVIESHQQLVFPLGSEARKE
jgi:hypothetical protein